MTTVLWALGAMLVCAGLLYAAYAIEPHWVAKDGRRFLTTSELVDRHGTSVGRRREVRGTIPGDGTLVLGKRTMLRTKSSVFRVRGKTPLTSRGRNQYVLEAVPPDPDGDLLILRVPRSSRLTGTLDEMIGADPGTAASAEEA
jgi:hypothetical protein